MNEKYARYLLKKTTQDYNLIAEQFSSTRYSIWPEFNLFKQYVENGERILDLGCGNGRLVELFKDKQVEYVGVDGSEKLIEIAKKKYPGRNFQVADALNLPFPNNYFDKIFCIAVLPHIPSQRFRLQVAKEARRVLKPGGIFIVSVWDLWRRPRTLKLIFNFAVLKMLGRSELDFRDVFIPWEKRVDRYVHGFTKRELKDLFERAGFRIQKSGIFRRGETRNYNIYLMARKQKHPGQNES